MKRTLATALCALMLSGCSVFMAAKQPSKKDLDVIRVGTHRTVIVNEFGAPVSSDKQEDGTRHEVYRFTQGFSKGLKAGRAIFHAGADVLTLGLWEIVGTPTEAVWDGTDMTLSVWYNAEDEVERSRLVKER